MGLSSLTIKNLRNLSEIVLEPGSRLNIIFGANGSGKSSILEAIYLLGRGRSFRTLNLRKIVRRDSGSLTLFATSQSDRLGVEITDSNFIAKHNGSFINKRSDLVQLLPLLFISPDGDRLISGSPRQRRRFLDWGLFHVEQRFLEVWQRYKGALAQRNAALRRPDHNLEIWNRQLGGIGEELDRYRKSYCNELSKIMSDLLPELTSVDPLDFKYVSGWNTEFNLIDYLNNQTTSDISAGFTQRGPHRGDFVITQHGKLASEQLSGGQKKIVACALILAQTMLLNQRLGYGCILLVDDLAAELDSLHRNKFVDLLFRLNGQVFITATDLSLFDTTKYGDTKMFHVEHGNVSQI